MSSSIQLFYRIANNEEIRKHNTAVLEASYTGGEYEVDVKLETDEDGMITITPTTVDHLSRVPFDPTCNSSLSLEKEVKDVFEAQINYLK